MHYQAFIYVNLDNTLYIIKPYSTASKGLCNTMLRVNKKFLKNVYNYKNVNVITNGIEANCKN